MKRSQPKRAASQPIDPLIEVLVGRAWDKVLAGMKTASKPAKQVRPKARERSMES